MTEVKLEELIDSIQEWCEESELSHLPPVARYCGSVDSYNSHPASFLYEESYD